MLNTEFEAMAEDRGEEFLAIINMLGYAMGIARDLGVSGAVSDLQAARLKLATELQHELAGNLSGADIVQLSGVQGGHC